MPRKRKRVVRRRGAGFFGDVWNGIKSVGSAVNSVIPIKDILKGTRAISTGLSFVPGVGGVASGLARAAGYGRRRKRGGMKMSPAIFVPQVQGGRKRRRKRGRGATVVPMYGGSVSNFLY